MLPHNQPQFQVLHALLLSIHLHRKQIRLQSFIGDCTTLTSSLRAPQYSVPFRHHVRSITSSQPHTLPPAHILTLNNRHIFRRAAARAVSAPRQLRATPRIASFQSSIPSISRSFHQSRIWRAEEQKETTSSSAQDAVSESSGTTSEPLGQSEHQSQNVAESASQSTPTPSTTSSPHDAVSESSGTTSEPVGQSEQSKPVTEQASELAEKTKDTVSDAAAKLAQAVGEATQQPKEKVQEAASEVSEQAQSAASSMARATRNTARSARDAVDSRNPFTEGVTPPSKILYIGNLFFEVTAPQLEAEFGQYGEIVNSRVVTDNRGLSKGFAYVEMATQKEADAAIAALNQKAFQGRRMSVQYHKRRTAGNRSENQHDQNKPSKTLFIGNMSYQMSDRDLNGKQS